MTTTFRHRRIIGEAPALASGDIVFRASRRIFGREVDFGRMGFTTVIGSDDYRRDDFIHENLRNDAEVVTWTTEHEACREVCENLLADGYGPDDMQDLSDADFLDMWRYRFTTGKIDID